VFGTTTISECTFAADTASIRFGGGLALWEGTHDLDRCTFYANNTGEGGAGIGGYNTSTTVDNSVVAFSTQGEPVYVRGGPCPTLRCCDVYGNVGGDWVGCIAGQYDPDLYGNICEDPLFCDPENGDFHLQGNSPCAPFTPSNPACDLVGAWPVGCGGSGLLGHDAGGDGDLPRGAWIGVQPNPCRDGARIRWQVPRAAETTLRLSTVSGRIVLTQRLGHLDAGVHELDWRAVDTQGAPLPCGVYLLDLSSSAQRAVRRVLVIR
jgi:hypothetical protein